MNSFDSSLVLKTTDTVFLVLNREGICTGFFEPEKKIHLLERESTIGLHYSDIIPASLAPTIRDTLGQLTRSESIRQLEFAMGSQSFLSVQILLLDKDRNYLISIKDISEEKFALETIQSIEKKLEEYGKSFNHDINNYIFKIKGFLDLIKQTEDFTLVDHITRIVDEMHTVLSYFSSKLLERPDSMEMTMIDLTNLVSQIARANIPREIIFIQDKLPVVLSHRVSVIRIFHNLFGNAVVHGNPHKITVSYEENRHEHIISISNDGTEISEEARKSLTFLENSEVDTSGEEGLKIVKKIIEELNWSIRLDDCPMTTFVITIPK